MTERSCSPSSFTATACGRRTPPVTAPVAVAAARPIHAIVPVPSSMQMYARRHVHRSTRPPQWSSRQAGAAGAERIASYLATMLGGPTGASRHERSPRARPRRRVAFCWRSIRPRPRSGSRATSSPWRETASSLTAAQPNGLFYGVQTIRQLLPWSIEHRGAIERRLRMTGARISDVPRFAWRGAMLDVSRHFIDAEAVKRYIDLLALYKLNRLHLHLADDQGWRIEIVSRPNLAAIGGSSQVGGGPGGYLHAGAVLGHRRLRDEPLRHRRARNRHARAHQCGARILSGAELQRRGSPALHRHESRLQRVMRDEGLGVHVHQRRRPRDLRAGAHAVLPHGRRRGAEAHARSVSEIRRARAGHRCRQWQADDRVGRDRAGEVSRRTRSCSTGSETRPPFTWRAVARSSCRQARRRTST